MVKTALVILCPSYVKYVNLSDDSPRGWLGESWHSGHIGATSPHPALFHSRRVDGWFSLRCHINTGATTCVGLLHNNNNNNSGIIIELCSFFFKRMPHAGTEPLLPASESSQYFDPPLPLHHLTSSSWLSGHLPSRSTLCTLQPSHSTRSSPVLSLLKQRIGFRTGVWKQI